MRKKRHWWNNYNFLAPYLNFKIWWSGAYSKSKKEFDFLFIALSIIAIMIMLVILAPFMLEETIAKKADAEVRHTLEMMEHNRKAKDKIKRIEIANQKEDLRRLNEETKFNALQNGIDNTNKYYEKVAKKELPIGTYIENEDGWVGKIKSIKGQEIITTDGWKCYYGDNIKLSCYKEYKVFINKNSKG